MFNKFLIYFRDDSKYHVEIMLFGLGILFTIIGIALTASGVFAPLGLSLTFLGMNGAAASPAIFLISNAVFSFAIGSAVGLGLHTFIKAAVGIIVAYRAKDSEITKGPDQGHHTDESILPQHFSSQSNRHQTSAEAIKNASCFLLLASYFFRRFNTNVPTQDVSTPDPAKQPPSITYK